MDVHAFSNGIKNFQRIARFLSRSPLMLLNDSRNVAAAEPARRNILRQSYILTDF